MKIFFKVLAISFLFYLNSSAQNWKVSSANITFKIKHIAGATADGAFSGFAGTIIFDANNLVVSSLKGTIDTKTFQTGSNMRDKKMKSEDYFDVEKYPKITMVSTKIEKGTAANSFVGTFNLTIKNTTKSIKIPFTFVETATQGQFNSSFTLNRVEYGVGEKSFMLNDIATVSINIIAQK